jgi:hypothetical protein
MLPHYSWSKEVANWSKMNKDGCMTTTLQQWLEDSIEGFSYSAAAAKTGIAISSVRRHVTESKKTQSVHETVVAVCRAYGLPVVEGLIKSGLITRDEADQFGSSRTLESIGEQALLEEMLRRVKAAGQSDLTRPITSEDIDAALDDDPDYSKLSDQDAYNLAAYKGDQNIAHDELPHEP